MGVVGFGGQSPSLAVAGGRKPRSKCPSGGGCGGNPVRCLGFEAELSNGRGNGGWGSWGLDFEAKLNNDGEKGGWRLWGLGFDNDLGLREGGGATTQPRPVFVPVGLREGGRDGERERALGWGWGPATIQPRSGFMPRRLREEGGERERKEGER
ncbi:hypothetical protein TIFTF001_004692 [Ficus carica]|uniref:Uncharacterized protein n=1 Tax=Ficus carica TaxID=3494 RepID=A0AA87ZK37_FICCA|nr:hypothetical protein TIFTF001_004692 [Ficus carica]